MAQVKHDRRGSIESPTVGELKHERDAASEPADFELDELLRTLRPNQWFAVAVEGMPLWVC